MATPTGFSRQPWSCSVASERSSRAVLACQAAISSVNTSPQNSIARSAVRSSKSRGLSCCFSQSSWKTWIAANHRHSADVLASSCGCRHGGKRHQGASTAMVALARREASAATLAFSTSIHGSIRGTAHTAIVNPPKMASWWGGTTSVSPVSHGGSGTCRHSSFASATSTDKSERSMFDAARVRPIRRCFSSTEDTETDEIAWAGMAPGQHTASSDGTMSRRWPNVHWPLRKIGTSRSGNLLASKPNRTAIACRETA